MPVLRNSSQTWPGSAQVAQAWQPLRVSERYKIRAFWRWRGGGWICCWLDGSDLSYVCHSVIIGWGARKRALPLTYVELKTAAVWVCLKCAPPPNQLHLQHCCTTARKLPSSSWLCSQECNHWRLIKATWCCFGRLERASLVTGADWRRNRFRVMPPIHSVTSGNKLNILSRRWSKAPKIRSFCFISFSGSMMALGLKSTKRDSTEKTSKLDSRVSQILESLTFPK